MMPLDSTCTYLYKKPSNVMQWDFRRAVNSKRMKSPRRSGKMSGSNNSGRWMGDDGDLKSFSWSFIKVTGSPIIMMMIARYIGRLVN